MKVPTDVLRSWPRLWELPEIWAAAREGESVDGEILVEALSRRTLHGASAEYCIGRLLAAHEFAAAEALIVAPDFEIALPKRAKRRRPIVAEMRQNIQQKRFEWLQHFESKCLLLQSKVSRLTSNPDMEDRIREAREWARVRPSVAERIIADVIEWMEAQVQVTEALPEGLQRLHEADRARWFPQRRRPWTNIPAPRAEVIGWLKGALDAPFPFLNSWGMQSDDPAGQELLAASEPFVNQKRDAHESEISRLISAFQQILRAECTEKQVLHAANGAIWGTLHGLGKLGFYAAEAGELPFAVAVSVPEEDHADRDLTDVPPPPYVYFERKPPRWPTAGALHLNIESVFRFVGDTHRDVNFVRELGRQLPMSLAFSRPVPPVEGALFIGRGNELERLLDPAGPVLVCGPPGAGRSALLEAGVTEWLARGWRHLPLRLDVSTQCQVPPENDRVLLTVDDLDEKPAEEVVDLVRDLAERQKLSRGQMRCIVAAASEVAWGREIAHLWVSPLDTTSLQTLVLVLLDRLELGRDRLAIADHIVHLGGGRIALMHRLLAELFRQLDDRERSRMDVDGSDIIKAYEADEFRVAARTMLLGPVMRYPALATMLAALLLEQHRATSVSSGVPPERLVEWPQYHELIVTLPQAAEAMARLASLSLVEEPVSGYFRIPVDGIGQLLSDLVVDVEGWLEKAASGCERDEQGYLVHL